MVATGVAAVLSYCFHVSAYLPSRIVVLNQGCFCLPRERLQIRYFDCHNWGERVLVASSGEGCYQTFTVHRTAPSPNKERSHPKMPKLRNADLDI